MAYQMVGGSTLPVWIEEAPAPEAKPLKSYADAGVMGRDGLITHTIKDRTGREILEFELSANASKRSTWMRPHCSQPQLMLALDKDPDGTGKRAERRLREFRAANPGYGR
jgi:hypothetical protein